jgi:hypothetical protein
MRRNQPGCKNFIYAVISFVIPLYLSNCTLIRLHAGSKEDLERALIKSSNLDSLHVLIDTQSKIIKAETFKVLILSGIYFALFVDLLS